MFKIKLEFTGSKLFEELLKKLENSGDVGFVLSQKLRQNNLTFSNPDFMKSEDGRVIAIYKPTEKLILKYLYKVLYNAIDKNLSPDCIGGRR